MFEQVKTMVIKIKTSFIVTIKIKFQEVKLSTSKETTTGTYCDINTTLS